MSTTTSGSNSINLKQTVIQSRAHLSRKRSREVCSDAEDNDDTTSTYRKRYKSYKSIMVMDKDVTHYKC